MFIREQFALMIKKLTEYLDVGFNGLKTGFEIYGDWGMNQSGAVSQGVRGVCAPIECLVTSVIPPPIEGDIGSCLLIHRQYFIPCAGGCLTVVQG